MKFIQVLQKEPTIWGPLFLLATFALALKTEISLDLFLVAGFGVFLSATMQVRGFCYALVLLSIDSIFRHLFLTENHIWNLGIEVSFSLAFFITALAFEQGSHWIETLTSQIQIGKTSYEHLEEELAKHHENAQSTKVTSTEKIATLQKALEDLETEYASILILNEVLRKKTAHFEEKSQQDRLNLTDQMSQINFLKAECTQLQKEQKIFSNTNEMVRLNRQIMQELNSVRLEKEQVQLINQVLERLYLKENFKAKDAESEASSLKELFTAANQEIARLKNTSEMEDQLKFAQEKVFQLSQIEPLFRQLRKQFDEKQQVLEKTRRDLFQSDTELQKLKIEKSMIDQNSISEEVEEELLKLSQQLGVLEEENRMLEEIISELSNIVI